MIESKAQSEKHLISSRPQYVGCPRCECGHLVIRQCKSVCENCGYVESCEDSFVPNIANPAESLMSRG